MLSREDINKELGKNIFIYPLKDVRILGNSIDLTASTFAWTSDGEYIYDEAKEEIIVPPHKTACILTQEAIYVTAKIGGTYHSRVSIAKKGFGHIGTTLDPKYIGQSLIILHNHTNQTQIIKHKERIVSIIFHYLNTPILEKSHNSSPGHSVKLATYQQFDKYSQWCEANRWALEERELVYKFESSEDYAELKKKQKADDKYWKKPKQKFFSFLKGFAKKYGIIILLISILFLLLQKFLPSWDTSSKITFIGTLLAVILASIFTDWKK